MRLKDYLRRLRVCSSWLFYGSHFCIIECVFKAMGCGRQIELPAYLVDSPLERVEGWVDSQF